MNNKQTRYEQLNNPIEPSQSFIRRWLPTIVGVLIVLLGIVGFFVFQFLTQPSAEEKSPAEETSAETANWNTYRNEKLGFILRYPPAVNFSIQDQDFSIFSMRRTKDSETISDLVQLRIFDLPFSQMTDEVASFGRCKSTLDTQSGKATVVIALNSVDAFGHFGLRPGFEGSLNKLRECTDFNLYKDEIDYTNQLAIYYFILSPDGQTYRFELGAGKNYVKDGAKEIFDQILSTFKFIELDGTANWGVYRDQKFEILIPPQWHKNPRGPGQLILADNSPYYLNFDTSNINEHYYGSAIRDFFERSKFLEGKEAIRKYFCRIESCPEIIHTKSINVNGNLGIEFIYQYQGLGKDEPVRGFTNEIHRVILKNDVLYEFWTSERESPDELRDEYPKLDPPPNELFRKILDTFKAL